MKIELFIDHWREYEDSLYLIVLKRLTWGRAKQYCSNKGAHLMDVGTRNESDYINSQVRLVGNKRERFWIAVNDLKLENKFVSSDGSNQTFFNWDHNEPNQYEGNEDCVEVRLDRNGRWNDVPCNIRKSFVCEKHEGMYISSRAYHNVMIGSLNLHMLKIPPLLF